MTINIAAYEGSPSIGATEYSLPKGATYSSASPMTVAGLFELMLDLSALVAGDQLVLNVYEKVTATSAQVKVDSITFGGAQPLDGYIYQPILLGHGWDFTLTMISATARSIPFSIREVS